MSTKQTKTLPRLTVRSAAEMLDKEVEEMLPALMDQKYPKQGNRVFRTPYYRHAIAGMRRFFQNGKPALIATKGLIEGYKQPSRRENNRRVLEAFENLPVSKRALEPKPARRYLAIVNGVELRLSPDMHALENGEPRFIYFNCKNRAYDEETAKRLVEIAYWVLLQNGVEVRPDQVEFVDLFTGKTYQVSEPRAQTIQALSAEALQVTKLWDEI